MSSSPQTYFNELTAWAKSKLQGDEILTSYLSGEESNFIRFNRNLVRQAGSVSQRTLSLDLIAGSKHTSGTVQLSQDQDLDRAAVAAVIASLRDQRQAVPDDPYLAVSTDNPSTEQIADGNGTDTSSVVEQIRQVADGKDLVGIYADGSMFHGFASSLGQRNWFESDTFNFDWSFYLHGDKAVKNNYAGTRWDRTQFESKVRQAEIQLASLARNPIDLAPGGYRTYLSPTAVDQLMSMLSWGGFGLKARRTKQSPLLKMSEEGTTLDPAITISEHTAAGTSPNFQEQGFLRPDRVDLIGAGVLADALVSPRSAQEFGVATNGAGSYEQPQSLAMEPGGLPADDVLTELGTGLMVGNLWYLNFSDRAACRTTGMTRFATFWVEDGEVVAPANVMRFDDTIYNLFGSKLVGLTNTTEILMSTRTYDGRVTDSVNLPGGVVEEMLFTL
jgi:predicted Zn-dependent protease